MIAALKKVDYFASDNSERMVSAIHKLREFKNLDYPNTLRREVCEILMQEKGAAALHTHACMHPGSFVRSIWRPPSADTVLVIN